MLPAGCSLATYVIDSHQKRFVMNMQLKQGSNNAKPFRLKNSQKKPYFVWHFLIYKKKPKVLKKARISKCGYKKNKLATLASTIKYYDKTKVL